jgi:hypothetical protein
MNDCLASVTGAKHPLLWNAHPTHETAVHLIPASAGVIIAAPVFVVSNNVPPNAAVPYGVAGLDVALIPPIVHAIVDASTDTYFLPVAAYRIVTGGGVPTLFPKIGRPELGSTKKPLGNLTLSYPLTLVYPDQGYRD